jgi:O-antigen/teichoic acid export membrane protein
MSRRGEEPTGAEADAAGTGFTPPSIAAGGVEALIFRIVELISSTLLVIVTGRLMEPAGRGLYALAALTVMVLVLPFGPVWYGNVVELNRRRVPLRELFGGSIVIAAVGGTCTGLVALAVAAFLGDKGWVVALPAAVTPFVLLAAYLEGFFTGIGHVRAVNLFRLARSIVPLLFIAPPLLAGASPRTAIAIWTLSFIALPMIIFFPLRRLAGPPRLPRDRGLYRRVITYGGKIAGLNAVDTLHDRVGLMVLAVVATDAAVGVFSIAIAGRQILLVATQALALSTFRRIGTESSQGSAALTARTARHAILLTGAGGLALAPVAFPAVPWVLGPGYEDVPLLLVLLMPSAVSLAAMYPLYTYFQVQAAKPVTLLKVAAITLASNLAFTLALAPRWGVWGVAVATLLAAVVQLGVALRAFRAEAGSPPRAVLPGRAEVADYVDLLAAARRRRSRA